MYCHALLWSSKSLSEVIKRLCFEGNNSLCHIKLLIELGYQRGHESNCVFYTFTWFYLQILYSYYSNNVMISIKYCYTLNLHKMFYPHLTEVATSRNWHHTSVSMFAFTTGIFRCYLHLAIYINRMCLFLCILHLLWSKGRVCPRIYTLNIRSGYLSLVRLTERIYQFALIKLHYEIFIGSK